MPMKKTVTVLTLVMLFIFTVSTGMVMAQEKESGPPAKPPKADQMSPEEWEAYSGMMYEHHQKVAPIHDQLWAKQMEYDALAANPNSKPAEIKAVVDDMVKLRTQLRGEKSNFYNQAKAKGYHNYGKWGHKGYGPGYGHGYGRGYHASGDGYGPGYGCGYGPGKGHWRDKGGKGHHGGGHWRD